MNLDIAAANFAARTRGSATIALASPRLADSLTATWADPLPRTSYSIVAAGASGAIVVDVDGTEYLDYSMGLGSALFGHNPPFVAAALRDRVERGFCVGPMDELTHHVADIIARLTHLERVAFTTTGSEAVMVALRLARTVSLRETVAVVAGANHGQYDGTLAAADPLAGDGRGVPSVPGIPRSALGAVLVLPPEPDAAFEQLMRHEGTLAAVVLEPTEPGVPRLWPESFVRAVRDRTARAGVAMIVDEMVTGFRLAPSGAAGWFGVVPDMAVYGKAMTGELPIAAVAGDARYLDAIDGGAWSAEPDRPLVLRTLCSGTFFRHPLSLAAAFAVLREVQSRGPELQRGLNQSTVEMIDRTNAALQREGAELRLVACGSHFGPARRGTDAEPGAALLARCLTGEGVLTCGLKGFLSTAHTPEHSVRAGESFGRCARLVLDAGYRV